jgi:transcriptional regulator with XRE-family HTH domain
MTNNIFHRRIKAARELRGLSQRELSERAKMPVSSISHLETGSRSPSFDTLRRLATALEVTTDYLLGLVNDPLLYDNADPLMREIGLLIANEKELAKDFIQMLAKHSNAKRKNHKRVIDK